MINNLIERSASLPVNTESASLHSGTGGKIILNTYLYDLTKENRYKDELNIYLEKYIENIAKTVGNKNFSLCTGYSGILWLLNFLQERKAISYFEKENNVFGNLIQKVGSSIILDSSKKNYDFLHGMLGKYYGVRFICDHLVLEKMESDIIEKLLSFSEENENELFWLDHEVEFNGIRKGYAENYGLAHGIASIVVFLSEVSDANFSKYNLKRVISKIVVWLRKKEHNLPISTFPCSNFWTGESRLAWCHGDLGIAYSLFLASKRSNSEEIFSYAVKILAKCNNRDIYQSQVQRLGEFYDPGLCHGTGGISLLYHKIYQLTGFNENYERCLYFKSITEASINYLIDSYDNEHVVYKSNFDNSLLSGISGASIYLLTLNLNESFNTWRNLFLL